MMKAFDNLRLGVKIGFVVLTALACMAIAVFAVLELFQEQLLAGRLEELRAIVDSARSLAAGLQSRVAAGEMTLDDARKTYARTLTTMQYDAGQGYVFAYGMDGTTLTTADHKLIGGNSLDIVTNGRKLVREFRDAVRTSGEMVFRYEYARPGETQLSPKMSYVASVPGWDIFVGTGAYTDDLDVRFWRLAWALIAGGTALALLMVAVAWFIARRITLPLARLEGDMKQLASGVMDCDIPGQDRKDEMGSMARAVQVFKDNAHRAKALEREREEARATRAADDEAVRSRAEQSAAAEAARLVVGSIGAGLTNLAAKDLTFRVTAELPEAYRKLQTDFNAAIGHIEGAMLSLTGSVDAIQSGTREITTASDDLSRRTEQQAASLEETAAALDEITATVKKAAEGATHAREVVAVANDDANRSAIVVRKAVEAMDAMAASARQISQIIGVIDEIAFQTNLLALNAGVEAARAGDAGRGFAVVASEVRALAQRSAHAAKEIKGLISASSTQVDLGVELVGETGRSLERIMKQVAEINDVMTGIAAGAKEQAIGLEEVNIAINQMDQVTQQNAAMVEETTAASHGLSNESARLVGMLGQFTIGRTGGNGSMRRDGAEPSRDVRRAEKTRIRA